MEVGLFILNSQGEYEKDSMRKYENLINKTNFKNNVYELNKSFFNKDLHLNFSKFDFFLTHLSKFLIVFGCNSKEVNKHELIDNHLNILDSYVEADSIEVLKMQLRLIISNNCGGNPNNYRIY